MDDVSVELEDLRRHYSGAYVINGHLGTWTARRTDGTPATFRWTVPSGRQYTTEPTRYPI
jgi:hypothetical protein